MQRDGRTQMLDMPGDIERNIFNVKIKALLTLGEISEVLARSSLPRNVLIIVFCMSLTKVCDIIIRNTN